MDPRTARVLTRARILALALIAVAILGLAYLRFSPNPDSVSVPAGARAGQLNLEPCSYPTEKGSYPADCGTLVVPDNRANPGSRLIALPVTRIRAHTAHPGEPIFYLEGGPGLSNMKFAQADRYAADRDVVLVGYRGIDGSVRLDCPEVESALKHSVDLLTEASFRAFGDALQACARRLTHEGVDLAGYGLPQQVDDLEAARIALGYRRIDLLSQSAGTRTAMIYAWRYPQTIHRSVMIGVNPPGGFLWDSKTTDEQIGRYAALCAQDVGCRDRTDDLARTMRSATANMADRWLFLPIKKGSARLTSAFSLAESTSTAGVLSAPAAFDSWLAAAEGDPSGLWLQGLLGDLIFPRAFLWGEYADAGTLDAQAARGYFSSGLQDRDSMGYVESAFSWGGGRMSDAWPSAPDEDAYRRVPTSNVETLLIGGALDTATPPQVATKELLPHLTNGHQVVLPNVGHVTSFFDEQSNAGNRLINTFLAGGQVDTSLYHRQTVDLTPSMTAPATAKKLLGLLLGLASLTVVSLVWMAYRVRRRGHLGRMTSAVIRSLYPLVLGVGGWFLGLLVVLTTMPGVALDNQLLAVVAVAAPIGLGIYLAWVHQDLSTRTKATGFASAAAGALLGAWLGFNAATGFLAFPTTIVGATVGANVILIVLDSTRDRHPHDDVSDASATKILEAHASTG